MCDCVSSSCSCHALCLVELLKSQSAESEVMVPQDEDEEMLCPECEPEEADDDRVVPYMGDR